MKLNLKVDFKSINWMTVLKEYGAFLIGLSLFVIAWVSFILPAMIAGGGVTGISNIIYFASGKTIPISLSYFIINTMLLILGTIVLGKGFGFKTIFCIFVSSLMFEFYPQYLFVSDIESKLLNSIVGGAIGGVGLSMVLLNGGSTGGTDILVVIINKFTHIAQGKLFLFFDLIIVGSYLLLPDSVYAPTDQHFDLESIVCGVMVMVALSYVLDMIMNGVQSSVQVMIFSQKNEELADELATKLDRGITMFYTQGWFSKKDSKTLVLIVRQKEVSNVRKVIKQVDPEAFYSVTPTSTVAGRGFGLPKMK